MNRRERLLLTGCVALGLAVYVTGIGESFLFGHQGWCAARRAVAGQNFVEHGFLATRFGPVENFGPAEPEDFVTYWHHPVGIHLLVGVSFTLFGEGEVQARMVPALLMLLCLLLFWGLARRFWEGAGRWAALVLFVTTPMLGYYGPFVNQEPLVLTACLLATWLWVRWTETGSPRWLAASGAWAVAAAWSDWPWFVFAFGLASLEVWRQLRLGRGRWQLDWLLVFCPAVLLGLAGVVLHLVAIQGGDDPTAGFARIFSDRSGGSKASLLGLVNAAGHWWVDLFTPTLVTAGLAWLAVTVRDARRGAFRVRHGVALVFLAVGVIWTVTFRQGARIHEYWPFYAGVFFVIAGADVAERLGRWVREASTTARSRQAAGVLVVALVVLQAGAGLAGIAQRHDHPDPNNFESEDYRHRQVVLGRWLEANTERDDRIAFHDVIVGNTKFQLGYYLQRDRSTHKLDGKRRRFRPPRRAMAVVDLRRVPQPVLGPLLRDWLRQHPVTVVEDFAIADLRRKVKRPEVTWLRRHEAMPSPLYRWLVSSVHRPGELVEDPVLAAELLRGAGFDEEALATYASAEEMPGDLRHRVADHNLARLAGQDPDATSWLQGMTGLPDGTEAPIRFGEHLQLLGLRTMTPGRYGLLLEQVYRVAGAPGSGWRPFAERLSHHVGDPEDERKRPHGVRVYPPPETWEAGDLVWVRVYVSLHQDHDDFAVRFGFWRPVEGGKGKKQHMKVGGKPGLRVPLVDVTPLPTWPVWLRWLDISGIAKKTN